MSIKKVNVLGYANADDQFIVKANNLQVKISKKQ